MTTVQSGRVGEPVPSMMVPWVKTRVRLRDGVWSANADETIAKEVARGSTRIMASPTSCRPFFPEPSDGPSNRQTFRQAEDQIRHCQRPGDRQPENGCYRSRDHPERPNNQTKERPSFHGESER